MAEEKVLGDNAVEVKEQETVKEINENNEKEENNKYDGKILTSLNLLKIIAIVLVLFYHLGIRLFTKSINIGGMTITAEEMVSFLNTLIAICVPMFFLVSGALLLNKEYDHKKHIKKCFKLFGLIYLFSLIVLLIEYPMAKFDFGTFVHTIFSITDPYNNHLWYLQQLLVVYLFLPFLKLIIDKYPKYLAFITGFSILLLALVKTRFFLDEYNILFDHYAYAIVYFALGGLLERFIRTKLNISRKWRIILTVVLALMIPFLMYFAFKYKRHFGIGFFPSYQTIGVLAITVCVYLIFRINDNLKYNKFIALVSAQTLFVYVFHYPAVKYLAKYVIPNIAMPVAITKLICLVLLFVIFTIIGHYLCKIKFVKSMFKL